MKKRYLLSTLLLAAVVTACTGISQGTALQTITMAAETELNEAQARAETRAQMERQTGTAESGDAVLDTDEKLQISVQGNGHTIVFELNGGSASKSLYAQLPLSLVVEDYSSNEKIFYPPDKLDTGDTPLAEGGGEGGLAYFSPWGDVVMYYEAYGPYSGLYDLGTAVSGSEWIRALSGEILIEAAETSS